VRSSTTRRKPSSSAVDCLTSYLTEIGKFPLLTRREEFALASRIREGDRHALEQLVCANLRFVVCVAKKYRGCGVSLSDLVNEGNCGLMLAAEKFDASRGVKFTSCAIWWIRHAIVEALAAQGQAVRLPLRRANALYRRNRRAEDELADTTTLARRPVSLDAPVSVGSEASLLEYLPDEHSAAPDASMIDESVTRTVSEELTHLRPREATVLRLYFGLDDENALTLDQIGVRLGVTRERVRQIKERALTRLRESEHAATLASLRAS
jgi:RNA polymerase primary sigma factor